MNNRLIFRALLVATIGLVIASRAHADHGHHGHHHHHDYDGDYVYVERYQPARYSYYAPVLDARPIYERVLVEVPRESCGLRTVAYEERRGNGDSFAGTVMGGLVGAAIGHELGNGRGDATAVGGLIGASIGNNANRGSRVVSYRDQEVCSTRYGRAYEQRIVGYDVSYSYQGRIYQTRTSRHPGDTIAVTIGADY